MELDRNGRRLPRQGCRRPWRAAILPMAAPGREDLRVEAKEAEGVRIVPEAGEPWLLRLHVLVQPFHESRAAGLLHVVRDERHGPIAAQPSVLGRQDPACQFSRGSRAGGPHHRRRALRAPKRKLAYRLFRP
eukprot:scaffold58022_cov75-Phaeocystis_antarctica.AAC.1